VRPALVSRAGGLARPSAPWVPAGSTFGVSDIAQPNAQSVTLAVVTASLRRATGGTSMRGKPRFVITSPFNKRV